MAAGKNPKISEGLTPDQFQTLIKVTNDPWFFATFIYLIHPLRGKTKFELYEYQKVVLYHFLNNRFNIVLKFRQAGLTELIAMYCLWLAMYHSNKNIVILSLKERVAKKVLRKIKYMYKNLPDYLKVAIVNGRTGEYGTAAEMEFANGSTIASIPTTEDAGRSEGLSLLVIDEAAIMKWANTIWAAAYPTLSTGGRAIVNSTPYGTGNWYHSLWVNAVAGGNEFFAIRLKWQMHPERYRFDNDFEWYNQQRSALGPRKTAQEIDGNFLTSGSNVFDLMEIRAIEEELADWWDRTLHPDARMEEDGKLLIFKDPIPGEQYFLGADVATGRARDYSAFTLMNRFGEEYAVFKKKIAVDLYAKLLGKIGDRYNKATIAPEANDIGLAVVKLMQNEGYDNLYYSTALIKQKGKKKPKESLEPGWYTTKQNRPVIIDELEEDIRNNTIICKDPFFVHEAYTFIYDDRNKAVALGKDKKQEGDEDDDQIYTDDSILGKAIANHIRKGKYKSGVKVAPQG